MSDNPLDPVIKAYRVSSECFKMTQRAIKRQQVNLFKDSDWPTQPNARQDIRQAV
jgi:hypothetical protein